MCPQSASCTPATLLHVLHVVTHLILTITQEKDAIILPILWKKKLRPRSAEQLA